MFQKSVLKNTSQNESVVALRWAEYRKYLAKIDFIKSVKEEKYQDGFLKDIFENCLGYTLESTNPNDFNLEREKKNETDGKKADGVIYVNNEVIGIIELKAQDTKNLDKIEAQAFNYHNSHSNSKYIIISNFDELRFYIDKKTAYEKFSLFNLNYEDFKKLHLLLSHESIKADLPLKLKEKTANFEQEISKNLYKDFSLFRTHLFENLVKNNDLDKSLLLRLTQKLCDRVIFILFAEDRGLLTANTIKEIRERHQSDGFDDRSMYDYYKLYFDAINKGNEKLNIPKYNGGLFAEDETLDSLIIDDHILDMEAQSLSDYDFMSDVGVNILGHIFEQSLTDLEEINASINETEFDNKKSKRKKDGVFYTPEYITKYIVDNTLGKLCRDKREELTLTEVTAPTNSKKPTKKEQIQKDNLEEYRNFLLNLKILDPACGSGAFLNQALDFLIHEHETLQKDLVVMGDITAYYEIEKSILEHNLYGVDINEDAVEIAKLSLWLRTASKGRKLTKLANKIKCGNSLIDDKSVVDNAFVWEEEFPEVFENGGFDIVIGNPPYVRQELIKQYSNYLEKMYVSYNGKADLYVYFFEKAIYLLKENGLLGFISSGKFFEANYGNNLKEFLITNSKINQIINFGDREVFEGITAYPIILLSKKEKLEEYNFSYVLHDKDDFANLDLIEDQFSIINSTDFLDNGNFIGRDISLLLNKLSIQSKTLENFIEMPTVGVKTGFNDGFIVLNEKSKYIKNYVFGKNIKKYSHIQAESRIVFPYERIDNKYILVDINHLGKESEFLTMNKDRLSSRAIIKDGLKNNSKKYYEYQQINKNLNFEEEYIVYPNVSLGSNFTISKGNVIDMTSFIIMSNNRYLLSILNSRLTTFLMDLWAISRRGGYREYKNQYIKKIPILDIKKEEQYPFIQQANLMLELNKNLQEAKQNFLNELELEKIPKKLQNFEELDFEEFVKEYKKAKKLKFADKLEERNFKNEWKALFENDSKIALDLKSQIASTDKEIDKMVYELYGLNEDEIKIIEGI